MAIINTLAYYNVITANISFIIQVPAEVRLRIFALITIQKSFVALVLGSEVKKLFNN
jgi:hypothetical protein